MSKQGSSPQLQQVTDYIALERAAWKETYIKAYLTLTGYTVEQVELVEHQKFDYALNIITISYQLQKRHDS